MPQEERAARVRRRARGPRARAQAVTHGHHAHGEVRRDGLVGRVRLQSAVRCGSDAWAGGGSASGRMARGCRRSTMHGCADVRGEEEAASLRVRRAFPARERGPERAREDVRDALERLPRAVDELRGAGHRARGQHEPVHVVEVRVGDEVASGATPTMRQVGRSGGFLSVRERLAGWRNGRTVFENRPLLRWSNLCWKGLRQVRIRIRTRQPSART